MRDAYYCGFFYGGVAHQGVFEVDRAYPFAAGFYEIFGAVDNFDEALIVDGGNVAGFEPTVRGPTMGLVGRIIVTSSDPRATYLEFAGCFAVARRFKVLAIRARARDAQLDKWGGPALLAADLVALILGPFEHVAFQAADGGDRRGFRHAPKMHYVEIVFIERAHQGNRWGRATDDDAYRRRKLQAAGIFLKRVENPEPDGGHTASDGDVLLLDEIKHAFGIDIGSGQNQARAGHHAGVREAPGVGVEHGSYREDGVVVTDGKTIGHGLSEGMQHDGAVRVDDALGETGGAGSETHSGAVVFIELGVLEIVIGFGEELLVVQESLRDLATAAVGHDNHLFEGHVLAALFVDRKEHVVDQ